MHHAAGEYLSPPLGGGAGIESSRMYSSFYFFYQGYLLKRSKIAIAIVAISQLVSLYDLGISYSILCRKNRSINIA
jgi:hypothetical protein